MTRSSKPKPPDDPAALSFEAAMEQVESIIDRIERGGIGLEASLAAYEQGVKLIQHCRQIHKHAVQRVDDLTQRLMAGAEPSAGTPPSPPDPTDDDPES